MKLKWIILIAVAALVAAAAGTLLSLVNRTASDFTPPAVDLEAETSPFANVLAPRLLARLGYAVKVHNLPFRRERYAVIFRLYRDDEAENWRDWLAQGRRLVLLCLYPDEEAASLPVRSSHPLLRSVLRLSLDLRRSLDDFEFDVGAAARETVLARGGRPLIARETAAGGGEVLYIADNSVFGDRNLIRGDNAALLNNCVSDHFGEPVAFDYSSAADEEEAFGPAGGGGGEGEILFLFRGNFLFVFLQLVFLGLVFLLVYWKRFGPVRDPEQFARRSLLRHLEATGNFFEKTRNPLVFIDILDRYFLARVREIVRLVSGAKPDLEAEVRKRVAEDEGEAQAGGDLFALKARTRIAARDAGRERLILRLKGVKKHHV